MVRPYIFGAGSCLNGLTQMDPQPSFETQSRSKVSPAYSLTCLITDLTAAANSIPSVPIARNFTPLPRQ